MKALFTIVILLLSTACSKKVTQHSSVVSEIRTSDSLAVRSSYEKTDSTVITPGLSTSIDLLNPCDSSGKLIPVYIGISQGKSKTTVDTRSGSLKVRTDCDSSIRHYQFLLDKERRYQAHHGTKTTTKVLVSVIVHYRIPLWCWLLMSVGTAYSLFVTYGFLKTIFIKFR